MKEKGITPAQLKLIHTMLSKNNLIEHKADLCYSFSNGRTESSKELTLGEAKSFIEYLKDGDRCKVIINQIYHLAYLAGIIYGDTKEDKAMNTAKINSFLEKKGSVKKPLYKQTLAELKKTARQFEAIVKRNADKDVIKDFVQMVEADMQLYVEQEEYEKANECKIILEQIMKNPTIVLNYKKSASNKKQKIDKKL